MKLGSFLMLAFVIVAVAFAVYSGQPEQVLAEQTTDKNSSEEKKVSDSSSNSNSDSKSELQTVTLGSGCFWCTEAVFAELKGVKSAVSGYSNGHTINPTYKQICNGDTGHAEVVQVKFDPKVISLKDILEVFWQTHDPTTLNRQGADVGTQYRSGIFFHNEEQKKIAMEYKKKLDESGAFKNKIVTEITAVGKFYPAEKYHQDFFKLNPNQGYCRAVIRPKMDKFRKVFKDKLKDK